MKHSNTNMPCDNYGMAACSTSCSQYYECFKTNRATVIEAPVNKPLKLQACEINIIIDALQYAWSQTVASNGDIQAFCLDSEWVFSSEENLGYAGEAMSIHDKLLGMFEEGGFDVVITEDK